MKVYLDNGATTMADKEVVKAMLPFFAKKYGNPSSLHSFGTEAKEAVEKARAIIAARINASPDEIIFTSGGSESNNMAIFGIASKEKNHVITTKYEHPCVLNSCKQLEKEGFKVTYLDVDKDGFVELKQLGRSITDKTCLVSVMHANNEIGVINDIEKIGEICLKHNVPFHTDAVQSLTKVPIDVKKQNITLASFSAHKIHGPKGVGALYAKKGIKLRKLIHGGEQEAGRRSGTENVPNIAGFGRAVELAKEEYAGKMAALRDYFIEEVKKKVPDIVVNGSEKARLCNNLNISFKYVEGESLLMHLDEKGIAVSTGSACSSHSLAPSHVLLAIGLSPEVAHGSIRFTLSRFTTKDELDYTLSHLTETVKKLRQISPLSPR